MFSLTPTKIPPSVSRFISLALIPALLTAFTGPLGADVPQNLDGAIDRLYNSDSPGAHRILDAWNSTHPDDPLGHALQAATFMFGEFARLQILEGQFFEDDKKIVDKKNQKPDPVVRGQFYGEIAIARKLAQAQLLKNPNDQDALFVMTISFGLLTDYTSLIEKKQFASLGYAREANACAQKLLALNPNYGDAYLTTGFSEYLLGSLPFFVRWVAHFDDTQGSKTLGISRLEKVASTGHYLGPFAKILLALIFLREKTPDKSLKLLRELSEAYPENPFLRKEMDKVSEVVSHKR